MTDLKLGSPVGAQEPPDERFKGAFRLLYTDIEDFVRFRTLSNKGAADLARHRLDQFRALFYEAMRPALAPLAREGPPDEKHEEKNDLARGESQPDV